MAFLIQHYEEMKIQHYEKTSWTNRASRSWKQWCLKVSWTTKLWTFPRNEMLDIYSHSTLAHNWVHKFSTAWVSPARHTIWVLNLQMDSYYQMTQILIQNYNLLKAYKNLRIIRQNSLINFLRTKNCWSTYKKSKQNPVAYISKVKSCAAQPSPKN